jgi:hypothetical protein
MMLRSPACNWAYRPPPTNETEGQVAAGVEHEVGQRTVGEVGVGEDNPPKTLARHEGPRVVVEHQPELIVEQSRCRVGGDLVIQVESGELGHYHQREDRPDRPVASPHRSATEIERNTADRRLFAVGWDQDAGG